MSERLEGRVERIRFVNAETHWTVASLAAKGAAWPVPVVGTLPGMAEGMDVRLEGDWVEDRRFGRQFKAVTYVELVPATSAGLKGYLSSGIVPGIGAKLAERIVDRFGDETMDVIAAQPERLSEVPGLGAKRREQIVTAFRERRGAQEALVFLHGLGITPGLANKIYQRYDARTISLVRANPYRLAEEVHGVGFHKADQVARGLDIGHDHPARARAGAYHVLLEARKEGHCYLPMELWLGAAGQLLGLDPLAVRPAVSELVGAGRVVLAGDPAASGDEVGYLTPLHDAEVGVARRLELLMETAIPAGADVDARLARASGSLGIELADEQADAVRLALTSGSVIITGGPGTGKTTIIRALLETAGLEPHKVALAAPTGRAAKRMSEATGQEARTIHRLLEFSPADMRFQRDEDAPLGVELVIIDEASMLDIQLFYGLVRAIPAGAALVLVGDVDQLPPVGPGAPFTDLIRSGCLPVARLQRIFRQGAGSAIIECAHMINRGEVPQPTGPGTPLQDFYFIAREDPMAILATIEELLTTRIPSRFGFDAISEVQVLAPMRSGIIGIEHLNRRLQELLNPDAEELTVGLTTYRVGDKVMQIRNDYDRGVFNGDLGLVTRVERAERRVGVIIDGREVLYERNQLDELVLAYAVSVHKSQGSDPAVVMPVSTQHFKMLQRNLLYTGLTRGKRLVVVVGTVKAMRIAVSNAQVATRFSQLAERLMRGKRGELL